MVANRRPAPAHVERQLLNGRARESGVPDQQDAVQADRLLRVAELDEHVGVCRRLTLRGYRDRRDVAHEHGRGVDLGEDGRDNIRRPGHALGVGGELVPLLQRFVELLDRRSERVADQVAGDARIKVALPRPKNGAHVFNLAYPALLRRERWSSRRYVGSRWPGILLNSRAGGADLPHIQPLKSAFASAGSGRSLKLVRRLIKF